MKHRITILPSLWLGGSINPNPFFIRRGFNPNPRPFPSPGEGMQPLASARSVTKVSATHQRVAGRFPTQQSCDCLCSLRSPQCEKPSNFGSCCDCLCGLARVTLTLLYDSVSIFGEAKGTVKHETTSNLKPQISNLKPQTSNLKPQTLNLKPQTSNLTFFF